jgi:hypothetical protein
LFLHQDGYRCAVRFGTEGSALVGVSAVAGRNGKSGRLNLQGLQDRRFRAVGSS